MHVVTRVFLAVIAVSLMLAGCSGTPSTSGTAPPVSQGASPTPESPPPVVKQEWTAGTPEHAVQAFYTEYLRQSASGGSGLHDRTYRQSPYLSADLIQQVDKILAGFDEKGTGGFDPFICGQNGPQGVMADKAEISGTEATLAAYGGPWSGGTWTKLTVGLRQEGARWKIRQITCPAR